MAIELKYLLLAALWNAIIWVPYILNLVSVRGLNNAVGYPADPAPMADWAQRLKAAHYNGVENLVLFATAIIVAHITGAANETTGLLALIYLVARVVYSIVYALGIPWLRTISFAVGFVATLGVFVQLLM
ncbi:MAG: MAPEG family protein [Gammaproteobacteria bacterium]|nr:MAPEG family protein [Gammaproteobacteria bacterium]